MLADVHLGLLRKDGEIYDEGGFPKRLQQQLGRVFEAMLYAHDNGEQSVVIAGDLFHSSDPKAYVLAAMAQLLERAPLSKLYILAGNHDCSVRWSAINWLTIHPAVHIVTEPKRLVIDDVPTILLPHMPRRELEARAVTPETYSKLIKQLKMQTPLIIGHGHYEGATNSSEMEMSAGDAISFHDSDFPEKTKLVVLGHIHKHQVLGHAPQVVYAGSVTVSDFGERKEVKGFLEVSGSLTPTWDFIPFESPQQRYVQVELDLTTMKTMPVLSAKIRDGVKGAVVKLLVKAQNWEAVDERSLRELFNTAGGRVVKIETQLQQDESRPKLEIDQVLPTNISYSSLLREWLEQKEELPAAVKKLALKLGKEAIENVG